MPRPVRYDLILMWERFKGFKPRQILDMLPKGTSLQTVYNYHSRWKKADKQVNGYLGEWSKNGN